MRYLLLILLALAACLTSEAQTLSMNVKRITHLKPDGGVKSYPYKAKLRLNEDHLQLTSNDTTETFKVIERYYKEPDYSLHFVCEGGKHLMWSVDTGQMLLQEEGEVYEFVAWDIINAYQFLRKKEQLFPNRETPAVATF